MVRRLKTSLRIFCGTLFFLALCATVGISVSTPPSTRTVEATYNQGVTAALNNSIEPVPREENGFMLFTGDQGLLLGFSSLLCWIAFSVVAVAGAAVLNCMIGLIWSEIHPR